MSSQSEQVSEFINITGVDAERARFYLESSAWNLQTALSSFYEHGDEGGNFEELNIPQDADVPPPTAGSTAGNNSSGARDPWPPAASKPKFGTIGSLRPDEEENSDTSDEEGQGFFVGGSERSGQQVLGPPKKKNVDKLVTNLFKSAKEHGGEEVASGASSSADRGASTFQGSGYRLGDLDTPSQQVSVGPPTSIRPRQVDMVLKMWKTGFSVDNGPLREYNAEENRIFLASVRKGEVPQELIKEAKGGEVNLNIEDHHNEDYVKPKVTTKAFSGEGNRLGSAVPSTVPTGPSAAGSAPPTTCTPVDATQPTTSIQIRLADGSRLVARFNHTHTVSDIRNHLLAERPQYANANFAFMTTFPNREITEESQSLQDAKLLNAVLVQRMK